MWIKFSGGEKFRLFADKGFALEPQVITPYRFNLIGNLIGKCSTKKNVFLSTFGGSGFYLGLNSQLVTTCDNL